MTALRSAGHKLRWAALCVLAATCGSAIGVMTTLIVEASNSALPPVALLFCRDFPPWVEESGLAVPPGLDRTADPGKLQRQWLRIDRAGYDHACASAFERRLGPMPPKDEPLPDDPPGWHVVARHYESDEAFTSTMHVVYNGQVWTCYGSRAEEDPLQARFACNVDVDAPLP